MLRSPKTTHKQQSRAQAQPEEPSEAPQEGLTEKDYEEYWLLRRKSVLKGTDGDLKEARFPASVLQQSDRRVLMATGGEHFFQRCEQPLFSFNFTLLHLHFSLTQLR